QPQPRPPRYALELLSLQPWLSPPYGSAQRSFLPSCGLLSSALPSSRCGCVYCAAGPAVTRLSLG
ncbi:MULTISPECIES: hypothetical protein, partial [unclassified Sphingomonas]|uniref:hypothetical protein n=1 Tax=unclassified Sphingomonas TaxID=196159 RepID=UPI00226AB1C8